MMYLVRDSLDIVDENFLRREYAEQLSNGAADEGTFTEWMDNLFEDGLLASIESGDDPEEYGLSPDAFDGLDLE